MSLVDLDLDLALTRLERDLRYGRTFFVHPFEGKLVSRRRADWLQALRAALDSDSFVPTTPFVANIPKGFGGVRPGALLTLQDQVVYTAAVGAALEHINPILSWSDPPKDFAYQIRSPEGPDWLSVPFYCWNGFRKRSIALLEEGPAVVVTTDITGFYEHIDHHTLTSDLRAAGVPTAIVSLLSRCLGRWCSLNRRGLPQSMAASHLLAKLYLTRIDHALHDRGYSHVRYVDDMRIFCTSSAEAKRALLELAILLRDRGLTLQSAKTRILPPDVARGIIEGTAPVVRALAKKFVREIATQAGLDPQQYMSVKEAEKVVTEDRAVIPAELLQEAYKAHFLTPGADFDKTLFHFLIRRLGKAGDAFAVDHCLTVFADRPEETANILAYLSEVDASADVEDRLLQYLESPEAVYDYQLVQFLQWRTGIPRLPSDKLLAVARHTAGAPNSAPYVQCAARYLLGRFGTAADLDDLMRSYSLAASDLERAEIVCSVVRVEKGQRNAFLGKVQDDGLLTNTACIGCKDGFDWFVD